MEIKNKTIVLMIDYDNFNNSGYLDILFEELKQMGIIVHKAAFYSNIKDTKIDSKVQKYGFNDFILEPSFSDYKNSVDIRMALEIMEWLDRDYVNCFCIATTDSDFSPIIKRIRQKNKIVIGAGTDQASKDYKNLFDRFISVDKISEAKKGKNDYNELINIVSSLINDNLEEDSSFVQFSLVMEELYKQVIDFNPRNYGSKNKKPSRFFQANFADVFKFKKNGKTLFIGINQV